MGTNTVRKVWKNTALLGVSYLLDRLVAFVVVIVVGRELGTVEFGRYSIGVAISTIVFQVSSLGLYTIVKRAMARERSAIPDYVGNAFPIEVLSSLAGLVVVTIFCLVVGYDAATIGVVLGIAVAFAFEPLIQLQFAVFESQEQMGYELAVTFLRVLLLICLPVLLAMGYGLRGIIVAWALVNLFRLGIAWWLVRSYFAVVYWRYDLSFWRRLITESYPLAFALFFDVIFYRVDAVILSFYRSEAEVGIYNAAYSFVNTMLVLSMAFLGSVFPHFARQACEPKRLSRTFYRSLVVMALGGIAVTLITSLFADDIIMVTFTSKFANSAQVLVILGWAMFFIFLSTTCNVMLNATGRQKVSMYITVCLAVTNIVLNLWLIPTHGYIGAGYVTLLSYILGFISMLVVIIRDFKRPEYLIALNASSPSMT